MALRVGARMQALAPAWRSWNTLARDEASFGYTLLLPAATLIVILVGVPFLRALWLSFHRKLLGSEDAPWIGLQNYATLLADAVFWQAVKNTFVFTVGAIVIKLAIGLATPRVFT